MPFGTANKISRWLPNLKSKTRLTALLNFGPNNRRTYALKSGKTKPAESPPIDKCPDLKCDKKVVKKRRSFLSLLFSQKRHEPKPPAETCIVKQAECKVDPDLSDFKGKALTTCGSAYVIIQQEILPVQSCEMSAEQKAVAVMEANFGAKDNVEDPMPEFTSVEQRMIDLNEKRLHPFYKRYKDLPKKQKSTASGSSYKTQYGPVEPHEIPLKLKFNLALLEKKNLYSDFKRVEPPRQLVARMVEINKNARSTMERRKIPVVLSNAKETTQRKIFDTLYQKATKF